MIGVKIRSVVLAALLSAALLAIAPATAAGPNAVVSLAGCTASSLAANDDSYTGVSVPIGFNANYYGTNYSLLSVNNNGNVTFDSGLYQYTPFDFTATGNVIIAPFLADVDTRTGSVVTYGQTTYGGNQAFCVNWVNVGYYRQHTDKTNSFQLLLVKQGTAGNFDIIFNYDRITWETGDASHGVNGFGGTSAAVGYSNGEGGSHSFVRAGSYTPGALLDGNHSTGLIRGSHGTTQLGRYIYQVRNSPATGSTLTGTVYSPYASSLASAPVEICRSGGSCISRFTNNNGVYRAVNLSAGSYTVTGHAPSGYSYTDGRGGPIAVSGAAGASFAQNVTLGAYSVGPPSGTTISNIGTTSNGVPIILWSNVLTLRTQGCTGGVATYQITVAGRVIRSGAMTQAPPGTYTAQVAALMPNHGEGHVHIAINCPGAVPDVNIDFNIYIDPSGVVRKSLSGLPVNGATVTLLRSDVAAGPFIPVVSGSAVMSPGNRTNPSTTGIDGSFGWDVVAGFYKVRATAPKCGTVESAVLSIPPPRMNLVLKLPCTGDKKLVNTRITKSKINAAKRTATFKFAGSGGKGKLTFQCKMDKKKFSLCKSGKTFKSLKRGKHTFQVRAKFAKGGVDKTPAVKKFKI